MAFTVARTSRSGHNAQQDRPGMMQDVRSCLGPTACVTAGLAFIDVVRVPTRVMKTVSRATSTPLATSAQTVNSTDVRRLTAAQRLGIPHELRRSRATTIALEGATQVAGGSGHRIIHSSPTTPDCWGT